jgi:hypothetical protein
VSRGKASRAAHKAKMRARMTPEWHAARDLRTRAIWARLLSKPILTARTAPASAARETSAVMGATPSTMNEALKRIYPR